VQPSGLASAPANLNNAAQATYAPQVAQATLAFATAPVPEAAVLGDDMQARLARVNALVDEVHRRITVNTSSLQNASLRIGALEDGLASAGKRDEATQAALKDTQGQVAAVQTGLTDADKRITANTHALTVMGPQIDSVKADLKATDSRLEAAQAQLAQVDAEIKAEMTAQEARHQAAHASLSKATQEALDRALAAGKLAEGRLVMESVMTEAIGFGSSQAGLSESGRLALVAFADKLKELGQGVYIEIQGHTDSSGKISSNLRLSRQRAEAVRDFLHQQAGLPLHRLATAAYGEARPAASNATLEGRAQNRRVVLVVLK